MIILASILLVSAKLPYSFTLEEVTSLPPLPSTFIELNRKEKIQWLKEKLASLSPYTPEHYRYNQELVLLLSHSGFKQEVQALCSNSPPLDQDYFYQSKCIFASHTNSDELEKAMLILIASLEVENKQEEKALTLNQLAWWLAQAGETSKAFAYYEEALSAAPSSDTDLLNKISFDASSNYIAHGNVAYVKRGIELLTNLRNSHFIDLEKPLSQAEKKALSYEVSLTYFNTGIAYLLHLEEYEKALDSFRPLLKLDNDIGANALSFSTYAAAVLGRTELAKKLLPLANQAVDGDQAIDRYLACYRQLAEQSWNSSVPLSDCLAIEESTAIEVKTHLFKKLSFNSQPEVELYGLRNLREIFISHFEPKFREQLGKHASNVEIKRLQRESELKSLVLEQKSQLQKANDEKHRNQTLLFIALFVIFLFVIGFILIQFRHKSSLISQFEKLSMSDSMTKLGNRRFLEKRIVHALTLAQKQHHDDDKSRLALILFDVDHFKKVNDTHGHSVGDKVLMEIAARTQKLTRDSDIIARWGGEEFMYVSRISNSEQIKPILDRIQSGITHQPFDIDEGSLTLNITVTIGAVMFPFIDSQNIHDWTKLVSLADLALYHGKDLGRNCWVLVHNKNISTITEIYKVLNQPLEASVEQELVTIETSKSSD